MTDVSLSAAVRSSLLSLQNTTDLIDRTQNRLSTGLKVASAVDDPVSFFQAKSLNDRASDFTEKKDTIDQSVSSVSAALEAIESIENIVRQLKGVANSLKSATGTQFTDLITQYQQLRTQVGLLADDATYQGINLVNNTTETLQVSFSDKTGSLLTINAVNVRASGLGLDEVTQAGANSSVNYTAGGAGVVLTAGELLTVTYQGSAQTLASNSTFVFTYGTVSVSVQGHTGATSLKISAGDVITLTVASTADSNGTGAAGLSTSLYAVVAQAGLLTGAGSAAFGTGVSIAAETTNYVLQGNSTQVTAIITELDSALTSLRANASTLGGNVALLQTRLDFTEQYVNALEAGAAKLTLADINEEGANLLALQTRQQLGISALAFAGQAEQGILSLFR